MCLLRRPYPSYVVPLWVVYYNPLKQIITTPKRDYMGVVLKVLVKEGPLGIHFFKKGILTRQGTCMMAILGTSILNNYHIGALGNHISPKRLGKPCISE